MIHLSDELIDKYIDNEAGLNELKAIDDHIKVCADCSHKLKAQKLVDSRLKRLDTFHAPGDFTLKFMDTLKSVSPAGIKKQQKNYLPRFIFAFLGLIIISILVFVTYSVVSMGNHGSLSGIADKAGEGAAAIFKAYIGLMKSQTVSVISGSVILLLFIGLYFTVESHRNFRNRLNNFK
ncbi:MAG: anti-sigma factor family protein [Syntrophothermus sp.]